MNILSMLNALLNDALFGNIVENLEAICKKQRQCQTGWTSGTCPSLYWYALQHPIRAPHDVWQSRDVIHSSTAYCLILSTLYCMLYQMLSSFLFHCFHFPDCSSILSRNTHFDVHKWKLAPVTSPAIYLTGRVFTKGSLRGRDSISAWWMLC